jgi:hypothetical protein
MLTILVSALLPSPFKPFSEKEFCSSSFFRSAVSRDHKKQAGCKRKELSAKIKKEKKERMGLLLAG